MLNSEKPRLAQPTDLEGVLRLAERKTYAVWPSQDPESRQHTVRGLLECDSWTAEYDLFVTEGAAGLTGFLVLKKHLTRGISGDRESVIQDGFALQVSSQKRLFECAAEAARSYQSQFLTLEIAAQEKQDQELVQALGFQLESHKISVPTADWPVPEGSPYSVRPPEVGDDFSIAVLNSTLLHHTLCAGRDYDLSELTFRSMDAILQQVNRQDPHSVALVLTQGQEAVGHLLLELSERHGYIYDLAVAQAHWGGKAVVRIMQAGSRLLFHRNIPLMVGDVSASNLRALKTAQRLLGFSVDCQRYGLRL